MRKTTKKLTVQPAVGSELTPSVGEAEETPESVGGTVPAIAAPAQPDSSVGMTAVVATNKFEVEFDGADLGAKDVDWGFLDPSRTTPAPVFPIEKLPPELAELIANLTAARRLPLDFVAFAVLAALSGVVGNRVRVLLFDGTLEPLAIFVALVGAPATGKSLAIRIVEPLLGRLDGEVSAGVSSAAVAAGQAALDRVNVRIRAKVAERLAVEFETPEVVIDQSTGRLLLSEATGPGLVEELSTDQMGRMFVTHELPATIGYLASSQSASSRGRFLQTFDGNPLAVASKSEGLKVVPAMLLTVLGAVQPRRLPYLMKGADDGFASRFLWIYPDADPISLLSEDAGPVDVLMMVLSTLQATTPARDERGYSAVVPLAPEARALLEEASAKWGKHQRFSDELFASALGRGRQYSIRIAAILEVATQALTGKPGLPEVVRRSQHTASGG